MTMRKKTIKDSDYWLKTINAISTSFNLASRDIDIILRALAKKLVKELGASALAIWTVEEKTHFMRIEESVNLSKEYIRYFNQTDRIKVGQSLVGKVMSGRKTLYALDVKSEKVITIARWRDMIMNEGFKSTISVPMFVGKKIVGAFSVYYKTKVDSIDTYQVQFIEIIANQIAITIENIKAYGTIEQYGSNLLGQVEKLLYLQKVTESFSLDFYKSMGKSLESYADYIIKRFNASGISVFRLEKDSNILKLIASYGLSKKHKTYLEKHSASLESGTLVGLAFKQKKIETSSKVFVDERIDKPWRTLLSIEGKSAMAAFPLVVQDEKIGAIIVYYKKPHIFSKEEIGTLSLLAQYMGISLLNIRVFDSLRLEQQKMVSMINSLHEGLIFYDLKGKITAFNLRSEELLWLNGKEIIGKYISQKTRKESVYWENLYNIKNLVQREFGIKEYTTKGPHKVILEITYVPVRDGYKKIGAMHVLRDITREKEIELLKSKFISTASHQMRTPLSGMKWAIDILRKGDAGDLNTEQKELTDKLFLTTDNLIRLINDMLDVTRIEEGKTGYNFVLGDLEKLVEKVIDDLNMNIRKKEIALTFKKQKQPLPKIAFDSDKLDIAVKNVIDNAIKYTRPNGNVAIELQAGKNSLLLTIKDDGIGIPKKDQKFIFVKFFRAENAIKFQTEGSGLGLYIAKSIMDKHNSIITFESEENKGAIFTLQFLIDPKKMLKFAKNTEDSVNEAT